MPKASATTKNASIKSRETVKISLVIALLNDFEFKLGNISNAYVQSYVTEKMMTTFGLLFSKHARKTAVVVRAIYGIKSAGVAFLSHHAK